MKMKKEKINSYGINEEIENLIRSGKPVTLVLRTKHRIYERNFFPIGNVNKDGNITFSHIEKVYKSTNSINGEHIKVISSKDLVNLTTKGDSIFRTIMALEINGYKLVSPDWKVI